MQVAAQPDVSAVIRRLLTMRDVELFLRNPAALNIAVGEHASVVIYTRGFIDMSGI